MTSHVFVAARSALACLAEDAGHVQGDLRGVPVRLDVGGGVVEGLKLIEGGQWTRGEIG